MPPSVLHQEKAIQRSSVGWASKRFLINFASQNVFLVVTIISVLSGGEFPITVFAQGHKQEEQKLYDAKGKRDPFVPLVRDGRFVSASGGLSSMAHPDLLLAGILWDPSGQSLALINDTEVKTGDAIGGYQVMEIRRDEVVLVRDGKPLILQLSFEDTNE